MSDVTERLQLMVGDITKLEVEAIVNAANESLLGGGGVDGAIHRAAGPALLEHNRTLGGCPTGEAKVTPSFRLSELGIQHIIHAVGPVWGAHGGSAADPVGSREEDRLLASCYRRCLEVAASHGARTVAFPAISTGVYGFPKDRAARIALNEVRLFLAESDLPERVVFCCYSESDAAIYRSFGVR